MLDVVVVSSGGVGPCWCACMVVVGRQGLGRGRMGVGGSVGGGVVLMGFIWRGWRWFGWCPSKLVRCPGCVCVGGKRDGGKLVSSSFSTMIKPTGESVG